LHFTPEFSIEFEIEGKQSMINKKHAWKRFLIALKGRDHSALGRAFAFVLFHFMGLLFAFPIILILWILKPFVWLKVGRLHSDRIGHLATNTDLFLRRRQLGIYPEGPYYCFLCSPRGLANRQLLTMFKRVIPIYESHVLILMFSGMLPIIKKTPFYQDLPLDSDEYYEFNNAKPSLYFTPDEIEKGRKTLKKMNVDFDKDKYVCIFARDDSYLKNIVPHNNWDYHNVRNSEIDKLIESAKYLIEKGYTVIRIGSIVKKPINFSHEKMIDYPYSEYKSDFLDIFLLANCEFVLSGGCSGLINTVSIFDKPTLTVNMIIGFPPFQKGCLYIPKKYKHIKTGAYLSIKDAIKIGPNKGFTDLISFGLEAEEASAKEILAVTKEMLARLEHRFEESTESKRLNQIYQNLWKEKDSYFRKTESPIGIDWLKENQALYLS
jgi:putative glycosyltransferase (TIGR04372 family)